MSAMKLYITLVTCPAGVAGFFSFAVASRKGAKSQLQDPPDEDLLLAPSVGEFDALSLVSVGTELKRSAGPHHSAGGVSSVRPSVLEFHSEDWEERFAKGETDSSRFVDSGDAAYSWSEGWVQDPLGVGAVPSEMARAEELLTAAEAAPEQIWKEKTAVRSLRMYHHARWLAERGHAASAEVRFHEAAALAKRSRRSILASHALGRLGYFLLQWCRRDEAKIVLREAEQLNKKSNPLATYLLGVILRKEAVNTWNSDPDKLHIAEEKILVAQSQPSDELEAERIQMVQDIHFWRAAAEDPWKCVEARDVAHMVICVFGHLGSAASHMFH
eukprot:gnl/MRDRNA2_/MRDRNA2_96131_c0_seq1.p1 gnl/MRDRNA2_/MRDRNA2_96131_c0~~gnl/MRDRNA2_/MRDRNA2_96131_c0_seq1.p1  ORF type:complete len:329 (-),score=64.10 gnl/MRDRNA2_/MRDRNA2_96131_c0_seq1:216-1202(-)